MSDEAETPRREAPPSFLPEGWDPDAAAPRFSMGKRVRLGPGAPEALQGLSGVVERVAGHAAPAPGAAKSPLYRVRFALRDLWGSAADGFGSEDTLDVELFETALAPFFDYGDFDAEKSRLEAELSAEAAIDEPARLDALMTLPPAPPQALNEIPLAAADGARHVVLSPQLDPKLRRDALHRPREVLGRLGVEEGEPAALRLHLATGRLDYALAP